MSASPEEMEDAAREEDFAGEETADLAHLPPARNSVEEDEPRAADSQADDEAHPISELLEEERHQSSEQPADDTGVVNRYKQLALEEADAASDSGSADALPRRAGSPVDSTVSIPDDTPSVQVCQSRAERLGAQSDLARALSSPRQVAASSRHWPQGLDWAVRLPRSGPSTGASRRASPHPATSLPDRPPLPSSPATAERPRSSAS